MTRRLLLVQSILLAFLVTWPAAAHFTTQAVGCAHSDTPKHVWTLWWMRLELVEGVSGLRTNFVNFPEGMDLYPIEPLHGLIAWLVPLPAVALSNLLAVLNVFLVGVCTGWLGWLVSRRPVGALVAGAIAQTGSFVAFTLHVGVGELRQVWWIPLGLCVLVRARETRSWGWFLGLGLIMGAATLSCFYHGFFLALAVAVVALLTLRLDAKLLGGYFVAAVLCAVIVFPVVQAFAVSYAPDAHQAKPGFLAWMQARAPLETYPMSSLELSQIFEGRDREFQESQRQLYAYGGGRYLGWATLALAAVGVASAPRKALPWLSVGIVGIVLAMGTVLWWDGAVVQPRIVLPLAWLNRALAYVGEPLNFPVRFLALTTIAVAVLGALACRWRWSLVLVPLAVIEVNARSGAPWPRDMLSMADMVPVTAPPGAVADFTYIFHGAETSVSHAYDARDRARVLGAQISLDRAFQTTVIDRVELWGSSGYYWTVALPITKLLREGLTDPEATRQSAWLLRDRGFGSILLTHPCDDRGAGQSAWAAQLDAQLGARQAGRCGQLWALPEVEAAPEEAAAWKLAQEERPADVRRRLVVVH